MQYIDDATPGSWKAKGITSIVLVSAAVFAISGCGSASRPPTGPSSLTPAAKPTDVQGNSPEILINTDPSTSQLARFAGTDGEACIFFGSKDTNGAPTQIRQAIVDGLAERVFITYDAQGRAVSAETPNGKAAFIDWHADNRARVTIVSGQGATPVYLELPYSGTSSSEVIARLRMASAASECSFLGRLAGAIGDGVEALEENGGAEAFCGAAYVGQVYSSIDLGSSL